MKKFLASLFFMFFGLISSAHAVLIDFNGGTAGSPIGGSYSGLGINFSNAAWHAPVSNQSGTPSTGLFLVDVTDTGFNPPFTPQPGSSIIGTFTSSQSMISILGFDIGGNGVQLDIFDAVLGGNLIGTTSFIGSGTGVGTFSTLALAASGIRRFELYQPLTGAEDGVGFDNLSFSSAIPEPTTLALMGLGLAGIGYRRHRSKKAA